MERLVWAEADQRHCCRLRGRRTIQCLSTRSTPRSRSRGRRAACRRRSRAADGAPAHGAQFAADDAAVAARAAAAAMHWAASPRRRRRRAVVVARQPAAAARAARRLPARVRALHRGVRLYAPLLLAIQTAEDAVRQLGGAGDGVAELRRRPSTSQQEIAQLLLEQRREHGRAVASLQEVVRQRDMGAQELERTVRRTSSCRRCAASSTTRRSRSKTPTRAVRLRAPNRPLASAGDGSAQGGRPPQEGSDEAAGEGATVGGARARAAAGGERGAPTAPRGADRGEGGERDDGASPAARHEPRATQSREGRAAEGEDRADEPSTSSRAASRQRASRRPRLGGRCGRRRAVP